MSSGHIAVNFGALDAARAALNMMGKGFNENQDQMATGVKPLHDIWVASGSEAASVYDQSTRKINLHEQNMIQLVNDFSRRVDEARSNQMAAENKIAGSFA